MNTNTQISNATREFYAEEYCPIGYEHMSLGNISVIGPCNHLICSSCVMSHLMTSLNTRKCIMCKGDVKYIVCHQNIINDIDEKQEAPVDSKGLQYHKENFISLASYFIVKGDIEALTSILDKYPQELKLEHNTPKSNIELTYKNKKTLFEIAKESYKYTILDKLIEYGKKHLSKENMADHLIRILDTKSPLEYDYFKKVLNILKEMFPSYIDDKRALKAITETIISPYDKCYVSAEKIIAHQGEWYAKARELGFDLTDKLSFKKLSPFLVDKRYLTFNIRIAEKLTGKRTETNERSQIHDAALTNDIEKIMSLINSGVDINTEDNRGCNILYYLKDTVDSKTIRDLIKLGADATKPNRKMMDGEIHPFMVIAKKIIELDDKETFLLMLTTAEEHNFYAISFTRICFFAVVRKKYWYLKAVANSTVGPYGISYSQPLMSIDGTEYRTIFGLAAKHGDRDLVDFIIEQRKRNFRYNLNGALTDLSNLYYNEPDSKYYPPLALAAQNGHIDVMQRLIKFGADINGEAKFIEEDHIKRNTPLIEACKHLQHEAIKMLISDQKIKLDIENHEGKTAFDCLLQVLGCQVDGVFNLQLAIQKHSAETLHVLLNFYILMGNKHLAEELLLSAKIASCDSKDKYITLLSIVRSVNNDLLLLFLKNSNRNEVKKSIIDNNLIDKIKDIMQPSWYRDYTGNSEGISAINLITSFFIPELEHDDKINDFNKRVKTYLHHAIDQEDITTVSKILDNGILGLITQDIYNTTPINHAYNHKKYIMINYLLERHFPDLKTTVEDDIFDKTKTTYLHYFADNGNFTAIDDIAKNNEGVILSIPDVNNNTVLSNLLGYINSKDKGITTDETKPLVKYITDNLSNSTIFSYRTPRGHHFNLFQKLFSYANDNSNLELAIKIVNCFRFMEEEYYFKNPIFTIYYPNKDSFETTFLGVLAFSSDKNEYVTRLANYTVRTVMLGEEYDTIMDKLAFTATSFGQDTIDFVQGLCNFRLAQRRMDYY